MILREVVLPENISGRLYLSYMPGRNEPFSKALEIIIETNIESVICLNPIEEITLKSPEYAQAIKLNILEFVWEHYPLLDLGVPEDQKAFTLFAHSITDRLKSGERILIHCAGGIGRTATLGISVLLAFGIELEEAQKIIREAGSMVQSQAQKELIKWICHEMGSGANL